MPHQRRVRLRVAVLRFWRFSTNVDYGNVYASRTCCFGCCFFSVSATPFAHLLDFVYDAFDFVKKKEKKK